MSTTPGCSRLAHTSASNRNRRWQAMSSANRSMICLVATSRPSSTSHPRCTRSSPPLAKILAEQRVVPLLPPRQLPGQPQRQLRQPARACPHPCPVDHHRPPPPSTKNQPASLAPEDA